MPEDRKESAWEVVIDDVVRVERTRRPSRFEAADAEPAHPWSYRAKRGRGVLRLTFIEYRILQFLAQRPNMAFSSDTIAAAVSTRRHCVTPETLSRYITSLRGQLGFYNDYIQAVPYIGYRFKP